MECTAWIPRAAWKLASFAFRSLAAHGGNEEVWRVGIDLLDESQALIVFQTTAGLLLAHLSGGEVLPKCSSSLDCFLPSFSSEMCSLCIVSPCLSPVKSVSDQGHRRTQTSWEARGARRVQSFQHCPSDPTSGQAWCGAGSKTLREE